MASLTNKTARPSTSDHWAFTPKYPTQGRIQKVWMEGGKKPNYDIQMMWTWEAVHACVF